MRSRFWASLLVSCLLVLGCSDDKKVEDPEPDPYMKQTSIANCLFNLKLSYNQRDLEKFRELFDVSYMYIFDPTDADSPTIPESWSMADEITSAARLFSAQPNAYGYVCESISLEFSAGDEVPSPIEAAWTDVTLSQISLAVACWHHDNGDSLRYEIVGDRATLTFMQTSETDPSSGLRIWKVVLWIDKPVVGRSAVHSTTWGKIKASWR